jgi:uncharacterized membrane protein
MEAHSGITIIVALLCSLIGLSLLFWSLRLIWQVIRSPVALAMMIGLLALTISLSTLQAAP